MVEAAFLHEKDPKNAASLIEGRGNLEVCDNPFNCECKFLKPIFQKKGR